LQQKETELSDNPALSFLVFIHIMIYSALNLRQLLLQQYLIQGFTSFTPTFTTGWAGLDYLHDANLLLQQIAVMWNFRPISTFQSYCNRIHQQVAVSINITKEEFKALSRFTHLGLQEFISIKYAVCVKPA
jgi:hypothetical protein